MLAYGGVLDVSRRLWRLCWRRCGLHELRNLRRSICIWTLPSHKCFEIPRINLSWGIVASKWWFYIVLPRCIVFVRLVCWRWRLVVGRVTLRLVSGRGLLRWHSWLGGLES